MRKKKIKKSMWLSRTISMPSTTKFISSFYKKQIPQFLKDLLQMQKRSKLKPISSKHSSLELVSNPTKRQHLLQLWISQENSKPNNSTNYYNIFFNVSISMKRLTVSKRFLRIFICFSPKQKKVMQFSNSIQTANISSKKANMKESDTF